MQRTRCGIWFPRSLRMRLIGQLAPVEKTLPKFRQGEAGDGNLSIVLTDCHQREQVVDKTAEIQGLGEAEASRW
jgi:hypothetical protein